MDIVVTVKKILAAQKFTSKSSGKDYTKYQFVGETSDRYPKTICFSCMNDETWGKMGIVVNNQYNVSFDLSSREYNGKFFTEVNVWKAVNMSSTSQPAQQVQEQPYTTTQYAAPSPDDMPF